MTRAQTPRGRRIQGQLDVGRIMLAALKAAKDDIGVVRLGGDHYSRCKKVNRQVRAAIAQAKAAGIEVSP